MGPELSVVLGAVAAVLLVAVLAVRISARLGFPSLLLYLAIGVVLGEAGIGIQFENAELTESLGLAALVLILTEGGLTTRWSEVKTSLWPGIVLSTVAVAVSIGVTGVALHLVLGFDWRFARNLPGVGLSLDASAPHEGARSLLVQLDGATDPAARLASQLAPTAPRARYRLRFAARTEELVSGGRPVVAVLTASGDKVLAESQPLPQSTGGWREYELEFDATDEAVLIVVRRAACAAAPCPAFGRAWFDDFSLLKIPAG